MISRKDKLLINFFLGAGEDWEWIHLKVKDARGKRELFIPNERPLPPETLAQKVERIRATTPDQLSPEDALWWQDIQFKLSQSSGGKQVQQEDTTGIVLTKLKEIGIH